MTAAVKSSVFMSEAEAARRLALIVPAFWAVTGRSLAENRGGDQGHAHDRCGARRGKSSVTRLIAVGSDGRRIRRGPKYR